MTFEEYKSQIVNYLHREKELEEKDIREHQNLSDEEKVEQGYLIKDCPITSHVEDCYELTARENNTKLRSGDWVKVIKNGSNKGYKATVVENYFNSITIKTSATLDEGATYDIHVVEAVYLDNLIQLMENLEDGASGSYFLNVLAQNEEPDETGYGAIDIDDADIPERLNENQRTAVEKVLERPSIYCIQGPPGTGKTDVLSTIAKNFSMKGKEVVVVSNTHQAVNNALNKIAKNSNLPVIKIGETLKATDLEENIFLARTYSEYLRSRPRRYRPGEDGAIVGMTLHAAIVNLGLRTNAFSPSVVLADEAGQIPFTFGSALGTFGAGTIVLIGDDRQMPPIYHPDLVKDDMSISIFSHLTSLYPEFKTVLDTTYRMNTEITKFVSKCFYEPYGITLRAFREPRFNPSIEFCNCSTKDGVTWEDQNPEEAKVAAEKALEYVNQDLEVAIVTPFRKQVNCIREFVKNVFEENGKEELPLVDTVERLQGQDVDVIIISTSVSNSQYYLQLESFILEPHRLNVMFSRAKEKVIVVKSDIVEIPMG